MEYQTGGFISYDYALDHLKNHQKHLNSAIRKIPETSPQYSHCQKELQSIKEIIGDEDVLQIYINNWNSALQNLYDIRSAAQDYGFSVSGLFNLEFFKRS